MLAPLSDVDTPEDLRVWDMAKESENRSLDANERICVIIPTLNEESNIVPVALILVLNKLIMIFI